MIPINKNSQDIHFRYKMSPLTIKYEGKNTGIKTILVNLEEIAKSIGRDSNIILKYFSYSLSLQVKYENKFIINGKHEQNKLQFILYDFIDHFVLCYSCENPETFFVMENELKMECLACGFKSIVRDHKLNGEISKNVTSQTTIYSDFLPLENQEINDLLNADEDFYIFYKNKGLSDEEIFLKILKESDDEFEKCNNVINQLPNKIIFATFENYVEKYKKYEKISDFLNFLLDKNFKKNEIFKFFTRPQTGKKRSLEFKKEINKYFS